MVESAELPVPVRDHPHWRVVLRPRNFVQDAIPTLSACRDIVGKNRVSLRGWDFPHVATAANPGVHGTLTGKNWIGGWANFLGQIEYWRFYQSKQFVHLRVVQETVDSQSRQELAATAKSHLSFMRDFEWDRVPGYLSMLGFIYAVTEAVEFAARLAQAGVYEGRVNCSIGIRRIRDYVLTPGRDRLWLSLCRASVEDLDNEWTFAADSLIADSARESVLACVWFFERLGWEHPNESTIERDIRDFLAREVQP